MTVTAESQLHPKAAAFHIEPLPLAGFPMTHGTDTGSGGRNRDIPRRVIKGGSHLCAPNYCLRHRPAARQAEAIDTSAVHIGFRCIVRAVDLCASGHKPA